jgi:uncharacterized protein (UPF0333 family)
MSIFLNKFESLVAAAEDAEMYLPTVLDSVPPTHTVDVDGCLINPFHTRMAMKIYLSTAASIKASNVKVDFMSLYARSFVGGVTTRESSTPIVSRVEDSFLRAFAVRNRMRVITPSAFQLFSLFRIAVYTNFMLELTHNPSVENNLRIVGLALRTPSPPSSFISGDDAQLCRAIELLKFTAIANVSLLSANMAGLEGSEVAIGLVRNRFTSFLDFVVLQSNDGGSVDDEAPSSSSGSSSSGFVGGYNRLFDSALRAIALPGALADASTSVATDVTSVADKVVETLTVFDASVAQVQETASEAKSFIDSFKGILADVLKLVTIDNLVTIFTKYVCPLVLAVLAIFQFPSTSLKVLASVCAAGALYAHGPVILRLINLRSEVGRSGTDGIVAEDTTVQFQSGLGDLPRVVTMLLTPIFNVGKVNSPHVLTAVTQLMAEPIQLVTHVSAVVKLVEKVTFLWNTLKRYAGWASTGFEKLNSGYQDVDEFNRRCMALFKQQELIPTRDTLSEVDNLLSVCARLKVKYQKETAVYRLVDQFTSQLTKANINLARVDFTGKPFRAEPVAITLYGAPGLGKSTADEIIADRLVRYELRHTKPLLDLYTANPDEFIFVRRNSEYWEGVRQHITVVRYPDYLAGKAEVTGATHETELIDLISSEKYIPNMAFETKGKLSLTPSYITMSTNETSIRGSTINHKGALARRLRLYELKWCGPKNSFGEMKPEPGAPVDIRYWQFIPGELNASYAFVPVPNEAPLTLDEVVYAAIIERDANVKKASSIELAKHSATQATSSMYDALDDFDLKPGMSIHAQVKALAPKLRTVKPITCDTEEAVLLAIQGEEYQDIALDVKKKLTVLHTYIGVTDDEAYFKRMREDAPKLYAAAILKPTLFNRTRLMNTNVLQTLGDKCATFIEYVKKAVLSIDFKLISAVLTLFGSAAAAYYFFSKEAGDGAVAPVVDESLSQQSKNYVDTAALARAKANQARIKNVGKFKKVDIVPQAAEHVNVGVAKARDHTFKIISNDGSLFTCAMALGMKNYMINAHAYKSLKDAYEFDMVDFDVTFTHAVRPPFKVKFSDMQSRAIVEEANDIVYFKISVGPDVPSVVPHWAPDKFIGDRIHQSFLTTSVGFLLPSAGGPQYCQQARIINGMTVQTAEGAVQIRQLWALEGLSTTGDCGAPYFATSNEIGAAGKFIGIHVAGVNGYGATYACAVSKSTIERAITALETGVFSLESGDRDVVDTISNPHHFYTTMTHVLAPSENPAKVPMLAPVEVNNPDVYARASAKYNKTVKPDPENLHKLKTCMAEYLQYCMNVQSKPMRAGMVSFRDACLGIPGTNLKGVDLSTSAGTPFNCFKLNKHDLIGQYTETGFKEGDKIEELYSQVRDNFRMLARGEIPSYVYTDVIKSETLPKEKVRDGKGRLISCAPLTLVIVTRMLFGHFLTWMIDNHLSNGFAGGDNMEGDDANLITLAHKAMSMDLPLSIAGDLSGYDTRHSADALQAGLEVMVDFVNHVSPMDPLTMRVYQTYTKSMSSTCHLRGDQLHYWSGSLASGHPLTTCLNSVENHGLFMYSVWKARKFEAGFFPKYFSNVIVRVLGDDNRASVSPAWRDYVSEQICATGYADFGHVYTSDTKDGITDHFRSFEETTLLKRFTRFEQVLGKYVAPLKLDVILELGLWTRAEGKERAPSKIQTIKNLDTMVKYLSFHEDKHWNEWIPKYEKMHEHIGWKCKYMSRESCLRDCYNSPEMAFGSIVSTDV